MNSGFGEGRPILQTRSDKQVLIILAYCFMNNQHSPGPAPQELKGANYDGPKDQKIKKSKTVPQECPVAAIG